MDGEQRVVQVRSWQHSRILLISTLLVVGAAAAMQAWPAETTPPKNDPLVRYTLLATLRQSAPEPAAQATAQKFFGLLLDAFRKVPGVTVRVQDVDTALPDDSTYRLAITSLATTVAPNGFVSYRTSAGGGSFRSATYGALWPWPVELRIERGGQGTPQMVLDTPLMLAREGAPVPAICTNPNRPQRDAGSLAGAMELGPCLSTADFAIQEAEGLRILALPLDSAFRQLLLRRVGSSAMSPGERANALGNLLRAEYHMGERELDANTAAAVIRLAAELPGEREMISRLVRGRRNPDLVPPLLVAMDRSVDENTRRETLITLLADYPDDQRVRAGLQVVASDDPSEFLRKLASYAGSGVGSWRSYALETVKRENLTAAERVRPLVFTADESSGDFRREALVALAQDPQIVDAVLAIARANRGETDIKQRGPVRRALYALTCPDSGPVAPGSSRQEAMALYTEFSGRLQPTAVGLPADAAGPK